METNGYNDLSVKETRFSCGGCETLFEDLFLLHNHMRDHVEGGSFNYNHTIKTAFPVLIPKDASTQTDEPYENEESHVEESMTSKDDELPFIPTEVIHQSDASDTKMYQVVKTEVADFQPVTFAFDDTDQFISDIVGSSKALGEEEQDTSTNTEVEKMDETENSSGISANETPPKVKGRPSGLTQSKKPKVKRMDPENTIIKCERCKVLVMMKHMKKHLLTFHNDQKIYKVNYKKRKTTKAAEAKAKLKVKMEAKVKIKKPKPEKVEKPEKPEKPKSDSPKKEKEEKKKTEKREKIPKSKEQDIVCQICGKHIKTRRILRRHIKVVHEKIKPILECEICGKKVQNLKMHVNNMHINHKKPTSAICDTCGRVFPNGLSLARHKIVHTEKYLTCRYCGYQCATHEEFQAHLKMHKKAKVYSCHICNSKFNTPGNIHKHIRSIHMGERRHFCDVCSKGFYTKGHLKAHRATHFEPTLKCHFCDRLFKEAGSRRIHERIHKCDQRYRCHICDHGFVQAGCYWSHMLKRHSIPKEQAQIIRQQQLAAQSYNPNEDPLRQQQQQMAANSYRPTQESTKMMNLLLGN